MEYELSGTIARIDASCYVLDSLTNMDGGKRPKVKDNYEPFIRNLRRLRPDVPIVMAGMPDVRQRVPNGKDKFVEALYDTLVAEGWKNLVWLPKDEMFSDDFEGTVDGTHANDWGMMALFKAYGNAVKKSLGLMKQAKDRSYGRMAELAHGKGLSVAYQTSFGGVIPGDILQYWKWCDGISSPLIDIHATLFSDALQFARHER